MIRPERKSPRLREWNYSKGCYFVTTCSHERQCLFGTIPKAPSLYSESRMKLSDIGHLCVDAIEDTNKEYENVIVANYVVMPNHIHMLVDVDEKEDGARSLLSRFVGRIKSRVTRQARQSHPEIQIWQPRYHDHIVRDEADMIRIWDYIDNNIACWENDRFWTE